MPMSEQFFSLFQGVVIICRVFRLSCKDFIAKNDLLVYACLVIQEQGWGLLAYLKWPNIYKSQESVIARL